jgi:hypothetical protein
MKRSLALLMIIVASSACTDSEAAPNAISQSRATEGDSGAVVVVSSDAGATELGVRVSNAGDPCELLSHDCQGSAAQCLEISLSGAFYAGGYCTADCKQSAECGPNAECPVAEAARVAPNYEFRSTWARKCFKSCTPGNAAECRSGYECTSLADAYETPDAPAPMHRTVCLPRAPMASVPSLDGGAAMPHPPLDAGH